MSRLKSVNGAVALAILALIQLVAAQQVPAAPAAMVRTHAAMRPAAAPFRGELSPGTKRFVDGARGNDANAGDEQSPWKTLSHSLRRLESGETLYVRGGTYYEKIYLSRSGTADSPITISAYPGEVVIIDGGLREFYESPADCWESFATGADGEYVSKKSYTEADVRKVPQQFLPAAWEPMWGIEDERPLALGHFADSMVPLHGYRLVQDLRAKNELWLGGKNEMRDTGIYCGPGMWFNRETGRVHIRLAHHQLAGLGERAYRGETDPRQLPLHVSLGFGDEVLRATGVRHVRLQGFVFRGATGSPMIHIYGCENLECDHLTIYGGFPALLIDASKNIRVIHSAFRGLAAPWTSRAHMKYRGTASYQIILQNHQPTNENIELAWCEFTDDHDFAFLRYAKNLQFHHNFVDNFNDDGLECGPKLRWHTLFVYQNRIGRCLIPLTQHEIEKDESPLDHDRESGLFLYRNIIDLRGGTYKGPPQQPDPSGSYLREEGHLVGDHGGPTWPVMHVYHNTVLRHTPVFRDYFLFGLGAQGLRNTERDVFNNLFIQTREVPGVGFAGITKGGAVREGGNILWGTSDGPTLRGDPFAKFRKSPLFSDSKNYYEAGWTTHDRVTDPKLTSIPADEARDADLRLQSDSPALNSGQKLPAAWPDPLRDADHELPDVGALPQGVAPWNIGVDGRISIFAGFGRN